MAELSCCIVTSEIAGPHLNGGVGTHCLYLADFLARRPETSVRVVYYGSIEREDEAFWAREFREKYGVAFEWIDPAPDTLPGYRGLATSQFDRASIRVAEHLRRTHADLYFFQELLGLGYRTFQMKRTGVAFQRSVLTCMVHSSLEWISEAMGALPQRGKTEAVTKQMERACVRWCDWLLSPSRYMLNWSQRDCEIRHPRAAAIPYLFRPEAPPIPVHRPVAKLIFFGRLEQRKGLIVFLQALEILAREGGPTPVPVTLLGRFGQTEDGSAEKSLERYTERVAGRFPLTVENGKNHHEAIEFLHANSDALVVCPSLLDNMPYAIIEAICLNCNLIAGNTGGIPELFADDARVFDPRPDVLAAKIRQALAGELPPLNPAYSEKRMESQWEQWLAAVELPPAEPPDIERPAVSGASVLLRAQHPAAGAVLDALGPERAYYFSTATGLQGPFSQAEARSLAEPSGREAAGLPGDVFLVPDGAIPRPDAPGILAAGALAAGVGITTGLSRYRCPGDAEIIEEAARQGVETLIGPLEPTFELLPFGNNVGWGCHYLTAEAARSLAGLKIDLGSAEGVANLLWKLLARGLKTDCVPVPIEDYSAPWPNKAFEVYERARVLTLAETAIDGQAEWVKHLVLSTAGATASARTWYRQEIRRSELWWKGRLSHSENWWTEQITAFRAETEAHKIKNDAWWQEKTDHWWQRYSEQAAEADHWRMEFEQAHARLVALRRLVSQRESVRYLLLQPFRRVAGRILSLGRGKR